MKKLRYRKFGLAWASDRGEFVSCVQEQAQIVREVVGKAWDANDWRNGWERAKRAGAYIVPVYVTRA